MKNLEDLENLGSQTLPNPAFLNDLAHENGPKNPILLDPLIRAESLKDREFLNSWVMGKSKHTKRAYLRVGEELVDSLFPKTLGEATLSILQYFVELNSGRSSETKRQRLAIVKSLFSFGVKTGYLKVSPAAFLPSVKSQSKLTERYLTEEEVMRMITLTEDLRDNTILRVLYSGGVRVSELVGLNCGDLKERENGSGQIKILGKGSKVRVVVLSEGTFNGLSKLKSTHSTDHDPIFISREKGRLSVGAVQLIVDRARLRSGIARRVSPHWLRHAHASHALDRGAPIHLVQATLGHASVATTGKYLHARPQESSGKYLGI